jgi:hypothetical protein
MHTNDKKQKGESPVRELANKHLKTPQSLIHIRHTISLFQYKLWILLLQEFKRQFDAGEPADENGFRYVSMSYLEKHLGYTPNRKDLINDLRALRKEEICFNYLEKDGYKAQYFAGFISEVKATRLNVGFKFPSLIDEVMLGLDDAKAIFQMLNWNVFNHFSGKYEAIIYKLCKDYIGVGRTPYMTVEELREYMGIKTTEYAEFMKLNEWVIKKPMKSINSSDISDIQVDAVYNRNGRKVVGLYFTVKSKHQTMLPFVEFQVNPAFDCAKVTIPIAKQQEYLDAYTPEQISLSIERANAYCEDLEKKRKSVNYGAIYETAIRENWGAQLQEQRVLEAKKKAKPKKEPVTASLPSAPSAEDLETKQRHEANKQLLARFRTLPEDEQHRLIEACIQAQTSIMKKMARDNYRQHQLSILEKPSFTVLLSPFLAKTWEQAEEVA